VVSQGLNDLLHQVVGYLDDLIGLLRRGPAAFSRATSPPSDLRAGSAPAFTGLIRGSHNPSAGVGPPEIVLHRDGLPEKLGPEPHQGTVPGPGEAPAPTQGPRA